MHSGKWCLLHRTEGVLSAGRIRADTPAVEWTKQSLKKQDHVHLLRRSQKNNQKRSESARSFCCWPYNYYYFPQINIIIDYEYIVQYYHLLLI